MSIEEQLEEQLHSLFKCTPCQHLTRIRTPFLLPDGDVLDLFAVEEKAGTLLLTDEGETLRWLRDQWGERKLPAAIREQLPGICQTHGIELWHGRLEIRFTEETEVVGALMRLAQAALRVSDLWFVLHEKLSSASPHNEPDPEA